MGCAERIVLARIKRVWVGIEDPDPTVDRKGIRYLQDSGVTVQMFDRDLQEVIHVENQRFIEQALERAAAAPDDEPRQVIHSTLEHPLAHCGIDDLSGEALEAYRHAVRIEDPVGSPTFNVRLAQQGVLKLAENQFVPTGYGIVLFGREPRVPLPQAGLLGTIHYYGAPVCPLSRSRLNNCGPSRLRCSAAIRRCTTRSQRWSSRRKEGSDSAPR
jgi:ATP-dependent DNA helicase RecG